MKSKIINRIRDREKAWFNAKCLQVMLDSEKRFLAEQLEKKRLRNRG